MTPSTPLLATVSLAIAALPAMAQVPTVSLFALQRIDVEASIGGLSYPTTVPMGPLASSGTVVTSTPQLEAGAQVHWFTNASTSATTLILESFLDVSAIGGTSRVGPIEILVRYQVPPATPAYLRASRTTMLPAGTAWPLLQLDLGNDGVVDATLADGSINLPASIAAGQPLDVRIVLDARLNAVGMVYVGFSLALLPQNALGTLPLVASCTLGGGAAYTLTPSFLARGVELAAASGHPCVHVLGLSLAPVLLPPLQCLLVPAPDILLFSPSPWQPVLVDLPAAVRPVTFYAQGVLLKPNGLETLNGFLVTAY